MSNTAFAAINVSQSSASNLRVKKAECKVLISEFKGIKDPKVSEMQEYAECVSFIYPNSEQLAQEKSALGFSLIFTLLVFLASFSVRVKLQRMSGWSVDFAEAAFTGVAVTVASWVLLLFIFLFYYAFS